MIHFISGPLTVGTAIRRGGHCSLHLKNLLLKTCGLMEEPRVTTATVEDFKCLLGGQRIQIGGKHSNRQWLYRTPIVISTKTPLVSRLQPADGAALLTRVHVYDLNLPIRSDLGVEAVIDAPPFMLCTCVLVSLFKRYNFIQMLVAVHCLFIFCQGGGGEERGVIVWGFSCNIGTREAMDSEGAMENKTNATDIANMPIEWYYWTAQGPDILAQLRVSRQFKWILRLRP